MNSPEEYQNVIELLKLTLKFYADNNNYVYPDNSPATRRSLIEIDGGSQARFALEQVNQLDELNKKMQEDYDNAMINMINMVEDREEDIDTLKLVEEYKKLGNENNNV
jgi:hypothetical protein